jgi:hypothetical protein
VPQLLLEPALQLIGAFEPSGNAALHWPPSRGRRCLYRSRSWNAVNFSCSRFVRTDGRCVSVLGRIVQCSALAFPWSEKCVYVRSVVVHDADTHTQSNITSGGAKSIQIFLIRFRVQLGFACQIDPSISDSEDYCRPCFSPGK